MRQNASEAEVRAGAVIVVEEAEVGVLAAGEVGVEGEVLLDEVGLLLLRQDPATCLGADLGHEAVHDTALVVGASLRTDSTVRMTGSVRAAVVSLQTVWTRQREGMYDLYYDEYMAFHEKTS